MPIDKFGRTSAIVQSAPKQFRPHYNLTSDGSIDWENRRLTGIKRPEENLDCVTKEFLEDYVRQFISDLQLKVDEKIAAIRIDLDAVLEYLFIR